MFSALVTTRRPEREASARATSVVVVPPLSPTEVTSSAEQPGGALAIARLASWCCPPR